MIWLVIKWIGIVAAALLALVLLTAVLVLFCPVRYRAKIQKTAGEWEAQGRISWLFGLLRVTLGGGALKGGSQDMAVEVRICGVRLSTLKKLFSRKKRQKSLPATADTVQEIPSSPVGESVSDVTEQSEKERGQEKKGTGASAAEKAETQQRQNPLKKLWDKILERCRGIKEAFLRFIAAIRNLQEQIKIWKTFLEDPRTRAAFGTVWQQAWALMRHVGPQRWGGSVEFGLEDPAATGQVLALLGAAYPIYGGQIQVEPVWDKKILTGNAYVKGRVYGIKALCAAGRVYFNKDVKYVIGQFRQNGGNHGTGK